MNADLFDKALRVFKVTVILLQLGPSLGTVMLWLFGAKGYLNLQTFTWWIDI